MIDTCAVEVGARLIAMDENGKINRLEDTALKIAKIAGIANLALGGTITEDEKDKFAQVLCDSLFQVLERRPAFAAKWKIFCSLPISILPIRSTP